MMVEHHFDGALSPTGGNICVMMNTLSGELRWDQFRRTCHTTDFFEKDYIISPSTNNINEKTIATTRNYTTTLDHHDALKIIRIPYEHISLLMKAGVEKRSHHEPPRGLVLGSAMDDAETSIMLLPPS